ncbi:MAG TPA: dihydroneopterin aldolase [Gaiellaceae bacterium]|jgi:7,8-dihydroneopterin aldolase/epimerase/oxygenase|nr:dihydroneopterin aldolase [Gaiellaceae bacterium]
MITVELHGLRVFGHHGVYEEERARGQDFLFDVELEVGERGSSDRIEDAVDYSAVARTVREISEANAYALLEALALAVADELRARFHADRATVRVTKPAVQPAGLPGTASVSVSRP